MTDADIFQAAMDNAESYHKEMKADDPDVEIVAEWKEIAFFEQGAKWAREQLINEACEWLRTFMKIDYTSFMITPTPQPGGFINAEDAFIKTMNGTIDCELKC